MEIGTRIGEEDGGVVEDSIGKDKLIRVEEDESRGEEDESRGKEDESRGKDDESKLERRETEGKEGGGKEGGEERWEEDEEDEEEDEEDDEEDEEEGGRGAECECRRSKRKEGGRRGWMSRRRKCL